MISGALYRVHGNLVSVVKWFTALSLAWQKHTHTHTHASSLTKHCGWMGEVRRCIRLHRDADPLGIRRLSPSPSVMVRGAGCVCLSWLGGGGMRVEWTLLHCSFHRRRNIDQVIVCWIDTGKINRSNTNWLGFGVRRWKPKGFHSQGVYACVCVCICVCVSVCRPGVNVNGSV